MKVLITGSSGFIGNHLIELFCIRGIETIGLDIRLPDRDTRLKSNIIKCDINRYNELKSTLNEIRPTAVIHLAARTDLNGNSLDDYKSNVDGVKNIISAIQATKSVKRCIITSSQLVCSPGYKPKNEEDYSPINYYGMSKIETERIAREANWGDVIWCIVRPTTVWGPGMGAHYQRFFRMLKKGYYFHIGHNLGEKKLGYVKNIAYQYVQILVADKPDVFGKTFYLADYHTIMTRDWVNLFVKEMGTRKIITLPFSLAKLLAKIGDLISTLGLKNIPYNSFRMSNITADNIIYDLELEKICGPLPYSIEDGVKETIIWLKDRKII